MSFPPAPGSQGRCGGKRSGKAWHIPRVSEQSRRGQAGESGDGRGDAWTVPRQPAPPGLCRAQGARWWAKGYLLLPRVRGLREPPWMQRYFTESSNGSG